jgi:beta-aspartyl-peptidase (threonine type)
VLTRPLLTATALIAAILAAPGHAQEGDVMTKLTWSIAIHGGAGTMSRDRMSEEQQAEYKAALGTALDAGSAVLAAGGTALDAVEAAIVTLEDDPRFNAGRGAVFTYEGVNELDASIMDGSDRSAGAVAGITTVKNPIRAARAVMENSPHVFLSREGAEQFAQEQGLEQAGPEWFATPERLRQLEELKARQVSWFDVDLKYGTVGAVALDSEGHLAAGTSTGGLTGKRWGRIGDSPVIGAGNYADDRSCAVSATGAGEYFIRANVAAQICTRMRLLSESAQQAADSVIAEVGELGGDGGVIVVAPDGSAIFSMNTSGMYRGRASSAGLREVAIFAEE